jgi:hypothetical protein
MAKSTLGVTFPHLSQIRSRMGVPDPSVPSLSLESLILATRTPLARRHLVNHGAASEVRFFARSHHIGERRWVEFTIDTSMQNSINASS